MKNTDRSVIAQVALARKMKDVNRCAGTRMLRPYTLDSHGAYVAQLFFLIGREEGIEMSAEQLFTVLNHDIVEVLTGDLLYPAKHASEAVSRAWEFIEDAIVSAEPLVAEFTDANMALWFNNKALALFKDCDMLELWLTVREEYECGNRAAGLVAIIRKAESILEMSQFATIRNWLAMHHVTL